MALTRGTHLGPYEIVALLGRGGMGEVYRARDPRLQRDVAIKVLTCAPDPHHLAQFEQEARAAAGLSHPNILAIYDVDAHGEQPFVVSELLEGETLRDKLSRGALPLRRAIGHANQIASGLAAAHAHGVVHRDLKPANLFLTSDGVVKILDFGLATCARPAEVLADASTASASRLAGSGVVAGTPSYMSPEQILGHEVDHRADIFAFGLVLYEMLTGHRAFDRGSAVQTMTAALDEEPPALGTVAPSVPSEIQLIVERCLEKKPDDRFQSTRDLCFSLTLASHDTDSAIQSRPAQPARRGWPAKTAVVALAVVTAFALGVVAGARTARVAPPNYQQLTFRRGFIQSARFSGDGYTVVYGAAWDGTTRRLWSTRPESPESLLMPLQDADILAISRSGEMAVLLGGRPGVGVGSGGVLARLPLNASAPREVLTGVDDADWAPDGQNLAVAHIVQGKYRLEFPIGTVLYEGVGRISPVRISHDGLQVAFVDRPLFESDDRGAVCVIDVSRKTKRVLSDGWSSVTGLAWAPGGREVWFTAAAFGASASLYAVDLAGRVRHIASSARRMELRDVGADGRVLLTEGSFRVRIGSLGLPSAHEQDLEWLDASILTDASADGRTLLINEQGAGGGTSLYAVYTRKSDGSPAVRLGEGSAPALSPDGRWVAALLLRSSPSIVLLPTGVGESRVLRPGRLADYQAITWFPDGRRLLLAGSEPGRAMRLWAVDVADGRLRAVSEEGLRITSFGRPISPDGANVIAFDGSRRLWLKDLTGTERSYRLDGLEAGYLPIGWHSDGESIYVFRDGVVPAIVYRFHLRNHRLEFVAELTPPDVAGVRAPATVVATSEGKRFFYSYIQVLSDLFLIDNLK